MFNVWCVWRQEKMKTIQEKLSLWHQIRLRYNIIYVLQTKRGLNAYIMSAELGLEVQLNSKIYIF